MAVKKRILVGVFLIGGALLFCVGLFLIGSRNQIFGRHYTIYTDFDKMETLTSGAKVRVSGMDAGQVESIAVPKTATGRFRLKLKVDEKFRPIVRMDSVTSIQTEGMVGNKFVDISKGSANSPDCPPGGTLPSKEPVSMAELMQQGSGIAKNVQSTIEDLRKRSDNAIQRVTALVTHVDGTVQGSRGDIKAITSNGAQTAENANRLVQSIGEGQGAAGKLLADPTVANNVSDTIANVKAASAQVNQAAEKANATTTQIDQAAEKVNATTTQIDQAAREVEGTTTQLQQAVGTFLKGKNGESTADRLQNTVDEADQAATNVSADSEALKHNFFLRGFFHRRGFYELTELTPQKYASTEFVKKPRLRLWVPAAGLFQRGSDGKQEMTMDGSGILDAYMDQLIPYLPDNPIMIEGYASKGTPDEQYRASLQRAREVENYLESTFHINPQFIGIMPLADRPPAASGKESWDGVCLVLVVSR